MRFFILITLIFFSSCSSIHVLNDYDVSVDFSAFKTFAYFKPHIDKVVISDLDKRRILKALDLELISKGLKKSNQPDLLISFSTKAKEKIYINNHNNWNWNPWFMHSNYNSIVSQTEGTLYINLIDVKTKQLIWQGKGKGGINEYSKKRNEKINLFVAEIMNSYPPKE
jgi:hypothetical protein